MDLYYEIVSHVQSWLGNQGLRVGYWTLFYLPGVLLLLIMAALLWRLLKKD